jgi:hypothetical protein
MAAACTDEETLTETRDILLTPDERYCIWMIKSAERPELRFITEDEEDGEELLPMVDGCDLPGWHTERLVVIDSNVLSVLRVGPGCSLLRRERQLPLLSTKAKQPWQVLRDNLLAADCSNVPRVSYTTVKHIHPWFERENVPVILEGCTDTWRAMETCQFDSLVDRFGPLEWRFSDTHGETMSLHTYQKYLSSLEGTTDDSPLAIYDSQYALDERNTLLDDYQVPICFDTDLFEGIDNRPPFQWILIGPARSGTGLHIDPVGTHAWVTLLQGMKRWVLFPYGTSSADIGMQDPQIPSVIWFRDYYDKVKHMGVEILQRPGETVYVPAGWPHLVLNLELCCAITHNYATEYPSMERLWQAVLEEPELVQSFQSNLEECQPHLAKQVKV